MIALLAVLVLQDSAYTDEARGFSIPLAGWTVAARDGDIGAVRITRGAATALVRVQAPMRALRGTAVDVREITGSIRDQFRKKFKDYEQAQVREAEGRLTIEATYTASEVAMRSLQILLSTPRAVYVVTWIVPQAEWEERRAEVEAMAAGFTVKP